MSIEEALEDYILNHSEEALSFLIGPKNGLYSLVMKLLAKNGIYRDRFSFDDFVYFLDRTWYREYASLSFSLY